MDRKLTILTGKFTSEEEYLILQRYPEKEETIREFQKANYFQIHKLYYQGFFQGYVVLFLGYNSLNTNDVSIEDLGFLRDENLLKPLMYNLLYRVKKHKVLSFPLEEFYYDASKFDDIYLDMFKSLDFQSMENEICRA